MVLLHQVVGAQEQDHQEEDQQEVEVQNYQEVEH
jgi:hypothetical protein